MVDYRILKTYISKKPPHPSLLAPLLIWGFWILMSLAFWENWGGFGELLPVSGASLFERAEYWRALSAVFIHGDLEHLLANTLFFVIFGYLLYAYFGALLFPVLTLAGAVLTNVITVYYYPPHVNLVGASGWVYLLAGTWLTLFVLIDRRLTVTGRTLRFLAVSLVLLVPETFKEQVSYLAHGVGFGIGILIGALYFYLNRDRIRSHEVLKFWEPEAELDSLEPTSLQDRHRTEEDRDPSLRKIPPLQ